MEFEDEDDGEDETGYVNVKEDEAEAEDEAEDEDEAEEEDEAEDAHRGHMRRKARRRRATQPGTAPVGGSQGAGEASELVNTAITKRPGTFPPPVSHQVQTGKRRKGGRKEIGGGVLLEAVRELSRQVKSLNDAMGDVAEMEERLNALEARRSFLPRAASADDATRITDEKEIISARKQLAEFDEFWGGNIAAAPNGNGVKR
jgi:hypothetical protein